MRAPVASFTKKLISTFFAATLAFSLVPVTAFAEPTQQERAPIDAMGDASEAQEDGSALDPIMDAPESIGGSSAVADDAALAQEDDPAEGEALVDDEGDPEAVPFAGAIIDEEMPLDSVVARTESARSFFLAQTLGSSRVVPMVSAKLPIDKGGSVDGAGPERGDGEEGPEEGEGSEEPDLGSDVSSRSTVIGSFASDGLTYAVEPGGRSVAVIAIDYAKLSEDVIQNQVLVIPEVVSPDGIEAYSVTRIADGAFASLTKGSADVSYVGCEALLADEELLAEAGIDADELARALDPEQDMVDIDGDGEADTVADPLKGCTGILAIGIPASVSSIEDGAFSGSDTLQYLVVSDDNPDYASFDGALYSADLATLRLIPEGRVGAVRIAPSAVNVDPEVFSHCPSVDSVIADADSAAFYSKDGCLYATDTAELLFDPVAGSSRAASYAVNVALNVSYSGSYYRRDLGPSSGSVAVASVNGVSSWGSCAQWRWTGKSIQTREAVYGITDRCEGIDRIYSEKYGTVLQDTWYDAQADDVIYINGNAEGPVYQRGARNVKVSYSGTYYSGYGSDDVTSHTTDGLTTWGWSPYWRWMGTYLEVSDSYKYWLTGYRDGIFRVYSEKHGNIMQGRWYPADDNDAIYIGGGWDGPVYQHGARKIKVSYTGTYYAGYGADDVTTHTASGITEWLWGPCWRWKDGFLQVSDGYKCWLTGQEQGIYEVYSEKYGNIMQDRWYPADEADVIHINGDAEGPVYSRGARDIHVSYTGTLHRGYASEDASATGVSGVEAWIWSPSWMWTGNSLRASDSYQCGTETFQTGVWAIRSLLYGIVEPNRWYPADELDILFINDEAGVDRFAITYEIADGRFSSPSKTAYTAFDPDFTLPIPIRDHYTFAGWEVVGAGGTGAISSGIYTTVRHGTYGSLQCRAKWIPVSYAIAWELDGGSLAGQWTAYTIESPDYVLPTPVRTGYSFAGWFDNAALTGSAVSTIPHGSSGDRTLWARWDMNTYHLTWDVPHGTHGNRVDDFTIADCPIAIGAAVPHDGYTFTGWSGPGITGTANELSITDALLVGKGNGETFAYHAAFSPNSYNAILHANDGTGSGGLGPVTPHGVTYDAPVAAVSVPKRYGYMFAGYFAKESDGSKGVRYFDEDGTFVKAGSWNVASDIDLYAAWALMGNLDVPLADPGSIAFALDRATGLVDDPGSGLDQDPMFWAKGTIRSAMPQEVPIASVRLEALRDGSGASVVEKLLGEGNDECCGIEVLFGPVDAPAANALVRFATPAASSDDVTSWEPDAASAPTIPAAIPVTGQPEGDLVVSDGLGNTAEMGELALGYALRLLTDFDMGKVSGSDRTETVARIVFTVDLTGLEHERF